MKQPEDNIILFQLVDKTTVISYIIEQKEDGDFLLSYPVSLVMTNPMSLNTSVLGYKYSPFAENNEVFLQSLSIITYSVPDSRLRSYYRDLVEYYKSVQVSITERDVTISKDQQPDQDIEITELDSFDDTNDDSEDYSDFIANNKITIH